MKVGQYREVRPSWRMSRPGEYVRFGTTTWGMLSGVVCMTVGRVLV